MPTYRVADSGCSTCLKWTSHALTLAAGLSSLLQRLRSVSSVQFSSVQPASMPALFETVFTKAQAKASGTLGGNQPSHRSCGLMHRYRIAFSPPCAASARLWDSGPCSTTTNDTQQAGKGSIRGGALYFCVSGIVGFVLSPAASGSLKVLFLRARMLAWLVDENPGVARSKNESRRARREETIRVKKQVQHQPICTPHVRRAHYLDMPICDECHESARPSRPMILC